MVVNSGMSAEVLKELGYGEDFVLHEIVNMALDREGNHNQFSLSMACHFGVAIQVYFADSSQDVERYDLRTNWDGTAEQRAALLEICHPDWGKYLDSFASMKQQMQQELDEITALAGGGDEQTKVTNEQVVDELEKVGRSVFAGAGE